MPARPPTDRSAGASSPERLLDILLMFQSEEVITLQQVSERFGASRSSTYRDLGFLKSRGFIEESGAAGSFRLGLAVERLASSQGHLNHLGAIARPHLGVLADATGESAVLCRRAGNRVSLLVGIDSRQMLRVSVQAADQQPLHRGSFGKVLLAFQRPQVIDNILSQLTDEATAGAAPPGDALRAELALIRRRGYAVSDSEVENGTRSAAVPVLARDGQLLGSLAVAGPSARLPTGRTQELLDQLAKAARAIADDWSGPLLPPKFEADDSVAAPPKARRSAKTAAPSSSSRPARKSSSAPASSSKAP